MTKLPSIEGRPISLVMSDPWELGESIGWEPLWGLVVKCGVRPSGGFGPKREALIIRLAEPLSFKGIRYEYLQGSPRHEVDALADLQKGEDLFCSFVCIPPEQVDSDKPFDLNWWRGGGTITGTVTFAGTANLLLDIIHLPRSLNSTEGESIHSLLLATGYARVAGEITMEMLRDAVALHHECVSEWLQYSEDKRSMPGWYFKRAGSTSLTVGYFSDEREMIERRCSYDDQAEACAAFIKREIDSVLGLDEDL
ncbi:MAG: hypothetical protein HQ523_10375 [Lentisphaerae bacterium]|nr:hypothetical protein [Lentisphaerota bacterium]